jgi:thioesterase domain-containing protein
MMASGDPDIMSAAPSLDRLRQTLSNVTWRETLGRGQSVIVPLNDQGTHAPFFCVHSLTGKATDYVPLAHRLGPDQPFFSIQIPPQCRTPDFGGLVTPLTITALAAHYVQALTEFRPQGPIVLGGWSVGAIIALEMAHQLRARGRDVPLLVIFDMLPWNRRFPRGSLVLRVLHTALHAPSWLMSHQLVKDGVQWGPLAGRAAIKLRALGASVARHPVPPEPDRLNDLVNAALYTPEHFALMRSLFAAARTYQPPRYDGAVQIYAARSEVALNHLSTLRWGWRHIAPRSRVRAMAGAHHTLFGGPGGEALARHMRAELAKAIPAA